MLYEEYVEIIRFFNHKLLSHEEFINNTNILFEEDLKFYKAVKEAMHNE